MIGFRTRNIHKLVKNEVENIKTLFRVFRPRPNKTNDKNNSDLKIK